MKKEKNAYQTTTLTKWMEYCMHFRFYQFAVCIIILYQIIYLFVQCIFIEYLLGARHNIAAEYRDTDTVPLKNLIK